MNLKNLWPPIKKLVMHRQRNRVKEGGDAPAVEFPISAHSDVYWGREMYYIQGFRIHTVRKAPNLRSVETFVVGSSSESRPPKARDIEVPTVKVRTKKRAVHGPEAKILGQL